MSIDLFPFEDDDGIQAVAVRAAAADRRADAALLSAIDDLFLPERDRLDERTRAAAGQLVEATVAAIERDIAGHAARLLSQRGMARHAALLGGGRVAMMRRLVTSGLLRDPDLMGELISQARVDLIDEALAANRAPGTAPALLARWVAMPDGVVRQRAIAYFAADSRRRLTGEVRRVDLPAELHHRLAWWVAVALREQLSGASVAETDRALREAAERVVAAYDEEARLDHAAEQLAAALAPDREDLPELLAEALAEGRLAIFIALLAQATAIDADEMRALVLDSGSDRLWLVLRALGFDRAAIARIGWLLSEADRGRDVEALAGTIDPIVEIAPHVAAGVMVPLALPRDFRRAVRALARSGTGGG